MKGTNEVSKLVGVSRRTLQYYDDEGVIEVKRSENNYRLYDQETLEQLWKIMIYKEMGLDLKKIKKLLSLTDGEQKEYFRLQVKMIEKKIYKLKEQKEFVLLILTQGIPERLVMEENEKITYASQIAAIRKRCEETSKILKR